MPRKFRSRNLAGAVSAKRGKAAKWPKQICLVRTFHCLPWTHNPATLACRTGEFDVADYRRRLAQLKADLREALATVKSHEKEIDGTVKEASRVALGELEDGLKDLLREVEQRKRRRSSGAGASQ